MHTESPETSADDSPEAELSALAREFHDFVADIDELIKSTTSLSDEDWARAKAKFQDRIATARQSIDAIGGTLSDRARNLVKEADDYVREQPWQAIGITAAAGVLVGYLVGRRG